MRDPATSARSALIARYLPDLSPRERHTLALIARDERPAFGTYLMREGRPTLDLGVIVEGRLQSPLVDFVAASRHGVRQNFGWTAVVVQHGSRRLDELIADTERGILFSGFAGSTDRDMEFSGATRNCFFIEEGKIVCAVDNIMISGNIRQLLHSVSDVSSEVVHSGSTVFPFLSARGVFIRSGSGAGQLT